MKRAIVKYLTIVGVLITLMYLSICGYLYFNQENLLFHPNRKSITEVQRLLKYHPEFDTLSLMMNDGIKISGYITNRNSSSKVPLVIYFEGNTKEVSYLMDKKQYFDNAVVALMNYRGWGLSEGKPTEQSMFSDAIEIYDKLKKLPNIDTTNIIVIGRSMGTGVATYLSAHRKVTSTILITPYDSMIDVAQEMYPFVPIFMLIKHPFESYKYAQNVTNTMLALIAQNDVVIPPQHAFNLMQAWSGNTTYLEVNEDHSSIMNNEMVWRKIKESIVKKN
jgi:uncharacterized protein